MTVFTTCFQRVEREIQQKLEEKEEFTVEMQETYASLQQEVDVKTKKLKKVSFMGRKLSDVLKVCYFIV